MYLLFQRHHKFDEIYAAKNLLGDWQITRRYGRMRTHGKKMHEIAIDEKIMAERVFELVRFRTKNRKYDLIQSSF